ncbi:hypothetical protein [Streptococcus parauberis]|uniref:hypothetical protein n=1 Tax=Streptococcus parauberis TaxID=1348 RepID=UPI000C14890D|nr:hypothetical protein [Streptococcus parauberis]PIA86235.1 hypothetical protein ADO07_00299 [Streptococcus parauberis]
MLNPFYWYTIIWGIVYFLYNLGWSGLNTPLHPKLSIFLIITILTSLALGFSLRKKFVYRGLEKKVVRNSSLTVFVVLASFLEFLYAKQIPLISISLGLNSYGEFQGIPILHSFIVNTVIFYSCYLYYLYLETKQKKLLIETILLISMLLLMFHKGTTIICLFIVINLSIAKKRQQITKYQFEKILLIIIFAIFSIYFNGILSNVRSGHAWNDNSLIMIVGDLKTNWPNFLPKEFAWTYIYITSSLANLNSTFIFYLSKFSLSRLVITIFPIFISKRIFPSMIVNPQTEFILRNVVLNSVTGFSESTVTGGRYGIWFFFIFLIILLLFLTFYIKKFLYNISTPLYAILSMQVVFLFFYNTISTSATSFLILYIIFFPLQYVYRISLRWR